MKRSIKSKNGFTLIEIVIVVSIIVILSAATFVGVDAVLDRANRNAQDLEEHHGAHFEEEAWATVKNLSVDVEAFKETSETSIDPTETDPTETDPTVTESTMPTNDKDADFLTRRDELIEMGYLPEEITIIYGDDGHIKSMSWRSTRRGFATGAMSGGGDIPNPYADLPAFPSNLESSRPNGAGKGGIHVSATPGVDAPGSSYTIYYGGTNGQIDLGGNADSVVVHLPDGVKVNFNGEVIDLGDGYYRINGGGNNYPSNLALTSTVDMNSEEVDIQIYIVEVLIHKY